MMALGYRINDIVLAWRVLKRSLFPAMVGRQNTHTKNSLQSIASFA